MNGSFPARIADALETLDEALAGTDVSEHPERFEAVHQVLRDELTGVHEGQ